MTAARGSYSSTKASLLIFERVSDPPAPEYPNHHLGPVGQGFHLGAPGGTLAEDVLDGCGRQAREFVSLRLCDDQRRAEEHNVSVTPVGAPG